MQAKLYWQEWRDFININNDFMPVLTGAKDYFPKQPELFTYKPLYSKCWARKIEKFCDLWIAKSKQRIAWEMHLKAFLPVLVRSVLFWSKPWSVTTSTEVHGNFTPAETRDRHVYTCLYSCLYSCVITGHRAGQDAHMHQNLALLVNKNNQLYFRLGCQLFLWTVLLFIWVSF